MDFEQVSAHFDKPIKVAAKDLGVCTTNLKKICRSLGIVRWPFRKVTLLSLLGRKLTKNKSVDPKP